VKTGDMLAGVYSAAHCCVQGNSWVAGSDTDLSHGHQLPARNSGKLSGIMILRGWELYWYIY